MKEIIFPNAVADLSDYDPERNGVKILEDIANNHLGSLIETYSAFARRKGHTVLSSRVLLAHGNSDQRRYLYVDWIDEAKTFLSIQDWIRTNETRHDSLFITTCNPAEYKRLGSERAVVIWPNGRFNASPYGAMFDDVSCGLFLPEDLDLLNISIPPRNSKSSI